MLFRPIDLADAADILAIYDPIVRTSPITFEYVTPSLEAMRDRIAAVQAQYPWIVAEEAGRVVGYAYATQFRSRPAYAWCCESSVYVHPEAQRRGLARGLYTALFPLLQAQGYRMVYAGITMPNPPSVALHESVGFEPVGVFPRSGYKFGAWHGVGFWALALDHATDPADVDADVPRPAHTLEAALWQAAFADGLSCLRV